MINNINKYNNKGMRGFTLGMSMIIMSILLTVALGMSIILLRDLKNSDNVIRSTVAYNLADGAMSCISGYEKRIRYINPSGIDETGFFATNTDYSYDDAYIENFTGENYNFNKDSLTCFEIDLLGESTLTEVMNSKDGPAEYVGGVRTNITLQTPDMINYAFGSCVEVEVYGKGNMEKLIITRAKLPCTGSNQVERVLVRSVQ